jgi:hypothetical protein
MTIRNDPTRKGELAAPKRIFGDRSRYAVAPIHTRFQAVQWFVWDADITDADGRPEVIRQENSEAAAVAGLDKSQRYTVRQDSIPQELRQRFFVAWVRDALHPDDPKEGASISWHANYNDACRVARALNECPLLTPPKSPP